MNDLPGKRRLRPRLPIERDGAAPDMHTLRTPLTVAILRAQVLRRHLIRGDDLPSLESELDQIEATLAELTVAIARLPATAGETARRRDGQRARRYEAGS